jgi:phosphoribosylanthranilate isomerase
MSKLLIKICGIKDLNIAEKTAQLGADYIGLIFYPDSKRHIELKEAKLLSRIIKKNGSIPVAVFVHQTAIEMQNICLETDINTIQLHGDISRREHYLLPENYMRLYVISFPYQGEVRSNPDIYSGMKEELIHCIPDRDFLLFDHIDSGKGKAFNWAHFVPPVNFRWFLAGGLNPDNIHSAVQQLKPTGIDVSSGVENQSGEKDSRLIEKFIKEARR